MAGEFCPVILFPSCHMSPSPPLPQVHFLPTFLPSFLPFPPLKSSLFFSFTFLPPVWMLIICLPWMNGNFCKVMAAVVSASLVSRQMQPGVCSSRKCFVIYIEAWSRKEGGRSISAGRDMECFLFYECAGREQAERGEKSKVFPAMPRHASLCMVYMLFIISNFR